MYARVYVCMHVCMYLCMYLCSCSYILVTTILVGSNSVTFCTSGCADRQERGFIIALNHQADHR